MQISFKAIKKRGQSTCWYTCF